MSDALRRRRAWSVVLVFVATLAVGVLLLLAFEPEVQTVDANELVARSDDARRFLIADYVLVALYAVLSPLLQWRFGQTLSKSPPRLIKLAVLLLIAAGICDMIENTALWSATDAVASSTVDFAHAIAIPKTILFIAAVALSLAVLARAAQALARPGTSDS